MGTRGIRFQIAGFRFQNELQLPSEVCNLKSAILIERNLGLVGSFIVAGGAAGFAVHEAVVANAGVNHRLAEAAKFLTLARSFRHFTLGAFVAGGTGSGAHAINLARGQSGGKMTLVTVILART
jgi:hypothetical protein